MIKLRQVIMLLIFSIVGLLLLDEIALAVKSNILASNTFNPRNDALNFNLNTGGTIGGPNNQNIGSMFQRLFNNQMSFTELFSGFLKMCSFGFFIATVLKFKQYKENPTQIPISTPFALLMVTVLASTSFMIIDPVSTTLFGDNINNDCSGLPGSSNCE